MKGNFASTSKLSASYWSPSPIKSAIKDSKFKVSSIEALIPIENIDKLTRHLQNRQCIFSKEYQSSLAALAQAIRTQRDNSIRPLKL